MTHDRVDENAATKRLPRSREERAFRRAVTGFVALSSACLPLDDLESYSGATSPSASPASERGAGQSDEPQEVTLGSSPSDDPAEDQSDPERLVESTEQPAMDVALDDAESDGESTEALSGGAVPGDADAGAGVAVGKVDGVAVDAGPVAPSDSRDAGVDADAIDAGIPVPVACRANETKGPSGDCFIAVEQPNDWDDARAACQARGLGWDLASVRSQAESDFLTAFVPFDAWLGATDVGVEETWLWVSDGLVFFIGEGPGGAAQGGAFVHWFSDEPNGEDSSDCMRILVDGSWADLECEELVGSVCQGPPPAIVGTGI